MTQQTMTKAAFARLCGVSKPAVAKWVSQGRAVLAENGEIHLESTAAQMRGFRKDGIPSGFQALIDGSPASVGEAPAAVGLAPAPPPRSDSVNFRRADLVRRLQALDWTTQWSLDEEGLRSRVAAAAAAVGFELAESDKHDDGHWGGYQLRDLEVMEVHGGICFEAIAAGHGFELDEFDVLRECREVLLHPDRGAVDDDDVFAFDLELLPALAYPFGPHHCSQASPSGDL